MSLNLLQLQAFSFASSAFSFADSKALSEGVDLSCLSDHWSVKKTRLLFEDHETVLGRRG
jgi:hypothetical protein